MPTITIYFQDLKESSQCRLWQAVQAELLSRGLVEPRQEGESEAAFQARLQEAADDYINTRNFAQEYCL
jgi:hypothetical protein